MLIVYFFAIVGGQEEHLGTASYPYRSIFVLGRLSHTKYKNLGWS